MVNNVVAVVLLMVIAEVSINVEEFQIKFVLLLLELRKGRFSRKLLPLDTNSKTPMVKTIADNFISDPTVFVFK